MIYLVGAGPGDPRLLAIKGLDVLQQADAVVYDRLIPTSLLDHVRPEAEKIYVGKRPGNPSMNQEDINDLLVELGRSGKTAVRLKGGDPFIFGRGGEEALALKSAGVPFEVVPGISSGYAVPAYAGIPVTHRGVAASVTFVTGHEDPGKDHTDVDWENMARGADTLVLYMGVGRLYEISRRLISGGRNPDTPVACIRWGTCPEQRTIIGTLDNIAEKAREADLKPPAITVVGDVVALRNELSWFEQRPLFGRRIVVTRARAQAGELSRELEMLGAEVLEFPTIEIQPPEDYGPLDQAISGLDTVDWLIFTSVNGVEAFLERLKFHDLDMRAIPQNARIAAIGPATAQCIERNGLRVDVVPAEYRAEALLGDIGNGSGELRGKHVLIPRASVAREVLPQKLREAGAEVTVPPAYTTVPFVDHKEDFLKTFEAGEIDCITFTSSSTVENFIQAFGPEEASRLLLETQVACIGPITADTARKHGIWVDVQAGEYTIAGLVDAVLELLSSDPE